MKKLLGLTFATIRDPFRVGCCLRVSTKRGLERFESGHEIEIFTDSRATKESDEEATP